MVWTSQLLLSDPCEVAADQPTEVAEPAILQGPSYSASIRAGRMEYNFLTRQIVIEDDRSSHLKYRSYELTCPRIEYETRDGGRLGPLTARGAGRLTGVLPNDEETPFEAAWKL